MKFVKTPIDGVFVIELEPLEDERGSFARTFCVESFRRHGLNTSISQCNLSYNRKRGTLRGMHWQAKPHEEAKLIRCIQGKIFAVVVDIRVASPSHLKWHSVELSAQSGRSLYIPEGVANGYQTLEDNTVLHYQMSSDYQAQSARTFSYKDPTFRIPWPIEAKIVSEKDGMARNYA